MGQELKSEHGPSVLLVDDNAQIRDAVSHFLVKAGYRVAEASNAATAVALIHGWRPDLVITDIFMPEGDGFELMSAIRERDLHIPVIVISGGAPASGVDYLAMAAKLGACAILDKPFTAKQLLNVAAQALDASP
jgi:DNA-binding NtrC family response regulator